MAQFFFETKFLNKTMTQKFGEKLDIKHFGTKLKAKK
jgi:hypothetical protein